MIPVGKAIVLILETVRPVGTETIPLTAALGRVLAEEVRAHRDHPPWDNAAMDGYAVRHGDTTRASIDHPVLLRVVETVSAGTIPRRKVGEGETAQISTGAPLPEGADSVVRIEETRASDSGATVQVLRRVQPGRDVRCRGEDLRRGETILSPGGVIGPAEVGLLALAQRWKVAVFRRPRVAVLATGEELAEPWEEVADHQVINTNSYTLVAQVVASGGEPLLLGIAADHRGALVEKIRSGLSSDLLLISGGAGPGPGDRIREALREIGAEITFSGVAIRPGHPVTFGRLGDRPIFALPGNPVAAMVCFFVLVRPALLKMASCRVLFPPTFPARLQTDVRQRPGKRHYLRAVISVDQEGLLARPTSSQGSGVLTSMGQANGFIILPEESEGARAGETVSVHPFRDLGEPEPIR